MLLLETEHSNAVKGSDDLCRSVGRDPEFQGLRLVWVLPCVHTPTRTTLQARADQQVFVVNAGGVASPALAGSRIVHAVAVAETRSRDLLEELRPEPISDQTSCQLTSWDAPISWLYDHLVWTWCSQ